MPPITPPPPSVIASWNIRERGVADGGSPNEHLGVDSNSATRVFRCNWLDRFSVAQWFVGYSQVYTDPVNGLQLSRLPPQPHPVQAEWYATKINSIKGFKWIKWDSVNKVNIFDQAEIEVLYEQVPYEVHSDESTGSEIDRYVEYPAQSPEAGGDYLALPGAAFKYTADPAGPNAGSKIDGRPIQANVGKIVPQMVFQVGWHRLPLLDIWDTTSPVFQLIFGDGNGSVPYFGCTNRNTLFGFPPGSLLLTGVRPYRRNSPTGLGWELDLFYEFTYKPNLWNFLFGCEINVLNPQNNGWYLATNNGIFAKPGTITDNQSIYCERPLENLFSVSGS